MLKKALIASAVLVAAFGAQAQSNSAGFSVTGSIAPVACSISINGGGEAAYGSMATSAVKAMPVYMNSYSLGTKQVGLAVTCPSPVSVQLVFTDNKSAQLLALGDGYDYVRYGLANGTSTTPIGAYEVYIKNLVVDGVAPAGYLAATPGTNGWVSSYGPGSASAFTAGPGLAYGFTKTAGATVPSTLTTIGGLLDFVTYVNKAYTDASTSEIKLNGSGLIVLQYV